MTRAVIAGRLDLDRATVDALVAHARSDFPYEVCGLLGLDADGSVAAHHPVPNAERSMTYYVMESRALLKAMRAVEDADQGLVIYHSHTHTEAFPSPTDVELAVYPEACYAIVSLQDPKEPVVRAFDVVDGLVTERAVTVGGVPAPTAPR